MTSSRLCRTDLLPFVSWREGAAKAVRGNSGKMLEGFSALVLDPRLIQLARAALASSQHRKKKKISSCGDRCHLFVVGLAVSAVSAFRPPIVVVFVPAFVLQCSWGPEPKSHFF